MQPTTTDINIPESALLTAYMMKSAAAYFKVNKRTDQMAQIVAKILEAEAQTLEEHSITSIKNAP